MKFLAVQKLIDVILEQQVEFEDLTSCHTCGSMLDDNAISCRHHDRVSGNYLDAVCQKCILQMKPSKFRNNINSK